MQQAKSDHKYRESGVKRTVPFRDLRVTDAAVRNRLLDAFDTVLRHGRLVMGPEVESLEQQVADRCGRRHAVAVSSGSDALFLALKSVQIGPGDEVITTSLSWIATANAIAMTGATPVFADISKDLNIDPGSVARMIGSRTKAIVPVHFTGKVCRMQEFSELATAHGIMIVEDAAQAFGARHQGRMSGSVGEISCFSMNPMKVLGACGEAGVVTTDREDVYERLIMLRYNGIVEKERCVETSLNYRVDTVQAAVLLTRLEDLESNISRRREIASRYSERLAAVVDVPQETDDEWDCYYTYTIQADRRDELKAFLAASGIETKIQHPVLMPHQAPYVDCPRAPIPTAERLVQRILCIPANEKLDPTDVEYVADCILEFYG